MTHKKPTAVERVELEFMCPKCGAPAEEWCRRWTSQAAIDYVPYLHRERFEVATNAGLLPLPSVPRG